MFFTTQRIGRMAAAAGLASTLWMTSAGPAAAETGVVEHTVTFTVHNVNSTSVKCAADGGTYHVQGRLTAPVQSMSSPGAVTLVLHGLSYGEFFADYTAQDGYNFAQAQAQAGHAVITIDRLGYGASDQPAGAGICFGSQADMAHQIVGELKSGEYSISDAAAPKFAQVVLAGHSVGGLISQIEAYTFHDIDGLMVLSYSDTVVSLAAQTALSIAVEQCRAGGTGKGGDHGAPGYIYFGADTPEKFLEAHFYPAGADPAVAAATASLRSRDPCGDVLSYKAAVQADAAGVKAIDTPTLVMVGAKDAIYPTPATTQAALLTGSASVTSITIPDTGHALVLHLSAPTVRTDISKWLFDHGFGGTVIPVGAVDTGGGSAAGSDSGPLFAVGASLILLAVAIYRRTGRRREGHAPPQV